MGSNKISKNSIIGENVVFGNNVTVYSNVSIGNNSIILDNTQIGFPNNNSLQISGNDPLYLSQLNTIIGEKSIIRSGNTIYEGVHIGANADITHNVVIRTGTKIGENAYILPNSVIHENVEIENNFRLCGIICSRTKIGNNVIIMGKLIHSFKNGLNIVEDSPVIKDGVFIGFDTLIIGGIIICENYRVNAGQIVTKSILNHVS